MREATDRLHSLQADFRWATQSTPPVMLPELMAWQETEPWFDRWLADILPRLPNSELAQLCRYRQGRLGKYFEALWLTYWQAHPEWQLRLSHFAIRDSERTLGELDAVLYHPQRDELLHIELAVKFFLHVTSAITTNPSAALVGPNLKDSLGRKYQHMIKQQLPLGHHPSVTGQLERPVDRSQGLIKGRFFEPFAAHLPAAQPQWLTRTDCLQQPNRVRICLLARQEWLSGVTNRPWWPLHDWLAIMGRNFHPYQALWQSGPAAPVVWRFIVPDSWPDAARVFIEQQQSGSLGHDDRPPID